MKRFFALVLAALVFVGAGCNKPTKEDSPLGTATGRQQPVVSAPAPTTVIDADGDVETEESMKKEKEGYANGELAEKQEMKAKNGSYKEYSAETVAAEQRAGNKVVLFFHAQWCPYCRAADAAFHANSEKIPAGYTVLKLDYDTQTNLKKKFGVAYQHTFVQIDNDGNLVSKWISGDIDMLVQNVK